jgi:hypothetical protein
VVSAGGDGRDAAQVDDPNGHVAAATRSPVTELARIVSTPGHNGAVVLERQAEGSTARYCRNALKEADIAHAVYLYRHVAAGAETPTTKGPVTQLARSVKTPGPDGAVALERQAVIPAGGYRDDVVQATYLFPPSREI